jgi:RING finger family protein
MVHGGGDCPVCQEECNKLVPWRGRNNCGHRICEACTLDWLYQKARPACPLCRDPIKKRDGDDSADEEEEEEEGLGLNLRPCVIEQPPRVNPVMLRTFVALAVSLSIAAVVILARTNIVPTTEFVYSSGMAGEPGPPGYSYPSPSKGYGIVIGYSARPSSYTGSIAIGYSFGASGSIAIGPNAVPVLSSSCMPSWGLKMDTIVQSNVTILKV